MVPYLVCSHEEVDDDFGDCPLSRKGAAQGLAFLAMALGNTLKGCTKLKYEAPPPTPLPLAVGHSHVQLAFFQWFWEGAGVEYGVSHNSHRPMKSGQPNSWT